MATAELRGGGSATDSRAGARRILVADDDRSTREVLLQALADEGYEVVEAADGVELLDRIGDTWLGARPYDLVISDIHMPGCGGLEAVKSLRGEGWETPVLFISGSRDPALANEARRCGADVLSKPVRLEKLLAGVRRKASRGRTASVA